MSEAQASLRKLGYLVTALERVDSRRQVFNNVPDRVELLGVSKITPPFYVQQLPRLTVSLPDDCSIRSERCLVRRAEGISNSGQCAGATPRGTVPSSPESLDHRTVVFRQAISRLGTTAY